MRIWRPFLLSILFGAIGVDTPLSAEPRDDAFLHYRSLLIADISRFGPDVIHPYFLGSASRIDSHGAAITLFLKELGRLAGKEVLPARVGVDRSDAFSRFGNIIFVLDDEENTGNLLDKYKEIISFDRDQERKFEDMKASASVSSSDCFSSRFFDVDHSVLSTNIFIKPTKSQFNETACSFREVLRSFGLHSDSPHGQHSIFRDGAQFEMLSPLDIGSVIFHYHNKSLTRTVSDWSDFWAGNKAVETLVYGAKK